MDHGRSVDVAPLETERLRRLLARSTVDITVMPPPIIQYRDDELADADATADEAGARWPRQLESLALLLLEILAVSAFVGNVVAMLARR